MDTRLEKAGNLRIKAGELFEWVLLGTALLLLTVTEIFGIATIAALILLAIFFVERSIRGRLIPFSTGIEIPVALFVLSAAAAAMISYQQGAALLQFARIVVSVAILFLITDSAKPFLGIVAIAFTLAGTVLAIYWPIHNDFSISPGKLAWITSIGKWADAAIPMIPGPEIHSNVAAGTILVSIPFGVSLVLMAWRSARKWLIMLAVIQVCILVFGLIMTSSRGAWVGLIGILFFALMILLTKRLELIQRTPKFLLPGFLMILAAVTIFIFIIFGPSSLLGQIPDSTGSLQTRWSLWKEGLILVQDYIFTGSGLQSFWMVHAIYGLLIHVPYLAHIHNSLLQIWIEQGILGAAAVCWGILVIAYWAVCSVKYDSGSLLGWAGLTAVVGAILHGFVDVVFYVERTLPVVGFLLGYSTLLSKDTNYTKDGKVTGKPSILSALAIAGTLILVTVFFYRPLKAAWYANMGAINQTQTELGIYNPEHFDNPTMDQVRQTANLSTAEHYFQKALNLQPTQRSAIHRLSMIALARGNYDQALSWMETCWLAGFRDTRTRLLYSDALVASSQPELAAQIAAGLTWAEDRLLGQASARYWSNQDFRRAAYAYQAVTLLNPSNAQAGNSLLKLEQILNK